MAEQQVQQQHPIPQQVLGVEFKIVGELTLRQFVVLALFGGLAYVIFSLPGVNPLIKIPLAGIALLLGVGFGLVPIQEQSLDLWLSHLFRAIYSPTRRVWQKVPEPPEFLVVSIPKLAKPIEEEISPEEARRRLEEYLAKIKERETLSPLDLAEKQQLEFINLALQETVPEAKVPPQLPPPLPPRPAFPIRKSEEAKRPSLASTINYAVEPVFKVQRGEEVTYVTTLRNVKVGRRFSAPTAEVVFAPAKERVIEPTLPTPPTIEPEVPIPPSPKVPPPPVKIIPTPKVGKPALPKKVKPLPSIPTEVKKPLLPTPPEVEKLVLPKKIKPTPPPKKVRPRPPLVSVPNSISGTVYDEEGEVVEGVLVAVKNQAGMTIIATTTNKLGQFSFSPLLNGSYAVGLPKAKLPFAIMKVELTGALVPPLEIRPGT